MLYYCVVQNCYYNYGVNVMLVIKTNQKCQTLSLIFHAPSAHSVTVTEHSDLLSTISATDQTRESTQTPQTERSLQISYAIRLTSFVRPSPAAQTESYVTSEHKYLSSLPPCFARVINSDVEDKRQPDIVLKIPCWIVQPPERC